MFKTSEVEEMFELWERGYTLDEAIDEIIVKYQTSGEEIKVMEIAEMVMNYFDIDSLIPKSRQTKHLGAMVVFNYLIYELIPRYEKTEVHKRVTELTSRDRTNFIFYRYNWINGKHLMDNRIYKGDTITNHMLNIKSRITGLDYEHMKIKVKEEDIYDKYKGMSRYEIIFDKNKEAITEDIKDNFYSFHELNNKYFHTCYINGLRSFFMNKQNKLFRIIRDGRKNKATTFINENRKSFLGRVRKGYTFRELNDIFEIYDNDSNFISSMKKHEPRISKLILENEANNPT